MPEQTGIRAHLGGHMRDLANEVKAGIRESGGFPLEVPMFSASEISFRPTAMMYCNIATVAVEAQMRGQPIDGAVPLGGYDKTKPGLLMGAPSTAIQSVLVTVGPMLNSCLRGERLGFCAQLLSFSGAVKARERNREDFFEAEASMSRSTGACNTMGAASTMVSMVEALGMVLAGIAAIPAMGSRRRVMAQMPGHRIVQKAKDDLRPSDIMTKVAFENATRTNDAIGGSTSAAVHLLAIAGRVGNDLKPDDRDRCRRDAVTIVNLMPVGQRRHRRILLCWRSANYPEAARRGRQTA